MICARCTQLRAQLRELETQRAADAGCKKLLEGEIREKHSEVLKLRLEGVRMREELALLKAHNAQLSAAQAARDAIDDPQLTLTSRTRRLEVD